ncbi:MAG: hypothetical protein JW395_2842 [Nitrospira sp.]|nr:hypothetical protein [Nitrospira sp.]
MLLCIDALVDQAALFVAPKTSYFLVSDLDQIGLITDPGLHGESALAPLLYGPGAEPQQDLDNEAVDRARFYFPFPSNRAQKRAALLVQDETTSLVRVEGPPGTGKSLTIANLACHLAATGKTVLITSQKDKALQVVDAKLRELNMAELPMTLLHRDRDSKSDLLRRLDAIKKDRSQNEVDKEFTLVADRFSFETETHFAQTISFAKAMDTEDFVERAHRKSTQAHGVARFYQRARFSFVRWTASRKSSQTSDALAETLSTRRATLRRLAVEALRLGRELSVSSATRQERSSLRQLAGILKRDQSSVKNFSLFDRLKRDPDRATMLLKLLPVWIMTPDDVARLFPCTAGLFDVVIVDEASQVDLPSILPIAFRARKVVIFGDSRQMQPRRFAFMDQGVTRQAWQQEGMQRLDPDRWFHPSEQSLLTLAAVRAQEEVLLDEHFRSLPPIIRFSNDRWYGSQLRIMTDERQKRFGSPSQPVMQLHRVTDGTVRSGTQENEAEAQAVVDLLLTLVHDPDYHGATMGIMCLFEEQVELIRDLVADQVPPAKWDDHDLVIINPDGFQGDERDVILYSLSYDANGMTQAALSARMGVQTHVQGMLNVAFTRARDEVHVFHSAPIESFTFAGGGSSALSEWLQHCAQVESTPRPATARPSLPIIGETQKTR